MQALFRNSCVTRLIRRWGLCVLMAVVGHAPPAMGQSSPSPAAPCRAIEGPAYLGQHDPSKTSVVVFVHGVLSNAISAWSPDADHSWPCLLRDEPAFNNSNIYLYGYQTNLLDESPSIEKVARQLLIELKNEGVLNHAHITIVAHSMGGLVIARMLLNWNSIPDMRPMLDRVKLVNFFGTPATGSDMANVARMISPSIQFEEMRGKIGQKALIDQWSNVSWPFRWYCLAEGNVTSQWVIIRVLVVPKESATALCRKRPPLAMETLEGFDHITMVKPRSLQDSQHRYLRRYFMSCVTDALPKTHPPSEAGSADGQSMLQALHRLWSGMSDTTQSGRDARLALVQDTLYQSDKWADGYLLPSNLSQVSLMSKSFERQGSRPFALEFIKLFDNNPNDLQPTWVGRLGELDRYFPDGQLTELRQSWTSAGYASDRDFVLTLRQRANGEQVVLLGSIQEINGERKGRIRGLLVLPAPPNICI